MCGIVAIYSESGVSRDSVARANETIAHRGPDGDGLWLAGSGLCGLGSRRLSLNDLEGGNQPLCNSRNTSTAVVNGEFYDFNRIRQGLSSSGYEFRTRSDSEILLPLYDDKGASCLTDLRGEFAFILWDEQRRTLFAARDRFGIKPLYYAWHDNKLVMASEIKALFAVGVPVVWDTESFLDHVPRQHSIDRLRFINM